MRKALLVRLAFALAFGFALQAQARDFYVLKSAAAGYQDVEKQFGGKAYYDGIPYLYSSISDAYSNCVTGRYDTIHVLKGHSEELSDVLTIAKSGVSIIGEGTDADRPIIMNAGITGCISVTANYVTLKNLIIDPPSTDNAKTAIAIYGTAAAPVFNNVVDNVKINTSQYGGNVSHVDAFSLRYATGTKIVNSEVDAYGGTSSYCPDSLIDITRAITDTRIENNRFVGYVGTAGIQDAADAGALSGFVMIGNVLAVTGTTKPAVLLNNVQGSVATGLIADNSIAETTRSTIIAGIITTANKANRCILAKQGYDIVVK